MNISSIFKILAEKERRVERQKELLRTADCLVSFSLNIPGPVKVSKLYEAVFEEGIRRLSEAELPGTVLSGIKEKNSAGYIWFLPIKCENLSRRELALFVKKVTASLEEGDSLGRLFDMDVLFLSEEAGANGLPADYPVKVSRTDLGLSKRKCLLCGEDAFTCLRAARHKVPEVMTRVVDIILSSPAIQKQLFSIDTCSETGEEPEAERTALEALRALFYEVITTPKPGLVDTENNGSHTDMDITTFFDSAVSIAPYLKECALMGAACAADGTAPEAMLPKLRPLGLSAEQKMFAATGGVNTHKGAVFTMGVLSAAAGYLPAGAAAKDITTLSGRICSSMENGSRGIRTEAMNGYPSVIRTALPVLEKELWEAEKGGLLPEVALNRAGVHALLHLIAVVDDANIERRSMCDGLVWARDRANYILCQGARGEAFLSMASDLDREFILRNTSPGGSADLLAAAYFLHFL